MPPWTMEQEGGANCHKPCSLSKKPHCNIEPWKLKTIFSLNVPLCYVLAQQKEFRPVLDLFCGLKQLALVPTYSPAAITGYLSSIESLSGTNFRKWKEQISIILGVMDLDYALRVDAPATLTAESSTEQKAAYEKWERSNRISLMIMKGSITTAIRGGVPDSDNAKLYLAHIEEQFQGSSKAHATTLITKMVTLKYSGSNGVREHILRMNDMASQLKGLDMEISEGFLVHFIMTSLPAQFGPFKINYNTQKEKWKMSELISMCVQEEERLKSEQPDSAHFAITGPSKGKGKGKKFGKGNVQGNKSASVTKTDKASSSGTKGSSGPRIEKSSEDQYQRVRVRFRILAFFHHRNKTLGNLWLPSIPGILLVACERDEHMQDWYVPLAVQIWVVLDNFGLLVKQCALMSKLAEYKVLGEIFQIGGLRTSRCRRALAKFRANQEASHRFDYKTGPSNSNQGLAEVKPFRNVPMKVIVRQVKRAKLFEHGEIKGRDIPFQEVNRAQDHAHHIQAAT
ncbi:hypothetical protein RJ639_019930 [Escallonia herrerae]|uniref:UBN2_2 domain-containing protein n=1 Tax=Escallonia herrerae TaxID=1293975 RepID=A0AA88VA08_9ASTE|nr:hypothetical protein RJ639_019930 [Escallonia herrerae]